MLSQSYLKRQSREANNCLQADLVDDGGFLEHQCTWKLNATPKKGGMIMVLNNR